MRWLSSRWALQQGAGWGLRWYASGGGAGGWLVRGVASKEELRAAVDRRMEEGRQKAGAVADVAHEWRQAGDEDLLDVSVSAGGTSRIQFAVEERKEAGGTQVVVHERERQLAWLHSTQEDAIDGQIDAFFSSLQAEKIR